MCQRVIAPSVVAVQELRRSGTEITDDLEEEYYMSRLDAGLFTLQLIDYIMLDVCHTGPSSVCCTAHYIHSIVYR